MIAGLLVAMALASAEPLTDRIRESAAAAQALQGPLSGAWVLRGKGGPVWLELADPPGNAIRASGAWRDDHHRVGFVRLERSGDRLSLWREGRLTIFRQRRTGVWVSRDGRSLARVKPPV